MKVNPPNPGPKGTLDQRLKAPFNLVVKQLADRHFQHQVVTEKKTELLEQEFDHWMEEDILDLTDEAKRLIGMDEESWNGS